MIRRETDPELVNAIANHPSVWPHLARDGKPIDFSPAFPATQSSIVVLTNGEDAAQAYEQVADRYWEVCTMFQDTCRGKRALEVGREMRDFMEPYADVIFGKIPDALPHAKRFYRTLGGERVDRVENDTHYWTAGDGEELFAWQVKH